MSSSISAVNFDFSGSALETIDNDNILFFRCTVTFEKQMNNMKTILRDHTHNALKHILAVFANNVISIA